MQFAPRKKHGIPMEKAILPSREPSPSQGGIAEISALSPRDPQRIKERTMSRTMTSPRNFLSAVLSAAAPAVPAVVLAGVLGLGLSAEPAIAKDKVKVGFIGPLTGGVSVNGLGGRNSADLAVRLRNAEPKAKYEYEMVVLDD